MQSFKNILGLGPSNARQFNINNKLIREEKLLSEGAFAFVWSARDLHTNKLYALKKIICQDRERVNLATREISFLEKIPPHPNLIAFYGSVTVSYEKLKEVNLLLELCDGGHLLDLLDKNNGILEEDRIILLFNGIIKGVHHLHTLDVPIAHRDLKVENILLTKEGNVKLCDFGSCSTSFIDTKTCSREDLLRERESIDRYTTMLYRSPEMIDLHRKYLINEKVDIWMLGCILFTMAFYRHPFQDESSLAISNAKYEFPALHRYSKKFTDLIHWMLSKEPMERPSTGDLLKLLEQYRNIEKIPLPEVVAERVLLYDKRKNADKIVFQKPLNSIEFTKSRKSSKRSQNRTQPDDLFNPSLPKWSKESRSVVGNADLFSDESINPSTIAIEDGIWEADFKFPVGTDVSEIGNNWATFDDKATVDPLSNKLVDIDLWGDHPLQQTKDSVLKLGGDSSIEASAIGPLLSIPQQNDFFTSDEMMENQIETPNLESLKDLQFNPSFSSSGTAHDTGLSNLSNSVFALNSNQPLRSSSECATTHAISLLQGINTKESSVLTNTVGIKFQTHDANSCTQKKNGKSELFDDLVLAAENSSFLVSDTTDTTQFLNGYKEAGSNDFK